MKTPKFIRGIYNIVLQMSLRKDGSQSFSFMTPYKQRVLSNSSATVYLIRHIGGATVASSYSRLGFAFPLAAVVRVDVVVVIFKFFLPACPPWWQQV